MRNYLKLRRQNAQLFKITENKFIVFHTYYHAAVCAQSPDALARPSPGYGHVREEQGRRVLADLVRQVHETVFLSTVTANMYETQPTHILRQGRPKKTNANDKQRKLRKDYSLSAILRPLLMNSADVVEVLLFQSSIR